MRVERRIQSKAGGKRYAQPARLQRSPRARAARPAFRPRRTTRDRTGRRYAPAGPVRVHVVCVAGRSRDGMRRPSRPRARQAAGQGRGVGRLRDEARGKAAPGGRGRRSAALPHAAIASVAALTPACREKGVLPAGQAMLRAGLLPAVPRGAAGATISSGIARADWAKRSRALPCMALRRPHRRK